MSNTFDKTKYDNDFAKNKYDRIPLQVPKGQKELILEYAKSKGYNSINAYIKKLIEDDMKR